MKFFGENCFVQYLCAYHVFCFKCQILTSTWHSNIWFVDYFWIIFSSSSNTSLGSAFSLCRTWDPMWIHVFPIWVSLHVAYLFYCIPLNWTHQMWSCLCALVLGLQLRHWTFVSTWPVLWSLLHYGSQSVMPVFCHNLLSTLWNSEYISVVEVHKSRL